MLKRNNTALAIIMTIALCVTCMAPALVAPQAASAFYSGYSVLKTQNVRSIATPFTKGIIEVDVPNVAGLATYGIFTIHLPSQLDMTYGGSSANIGADQTSAYPSVVVATDNASSVADAVYCPNNTYYNSGLSSPVPSIECVANASVLISVPATLANGDPNNLTKADLLAFPLDKNTIDIQYVGSHVSGSFGSATFYIKFNNLTFNDTIDGAITVNILAPSRSGWTTGSVTVGNFITGSSATVVSARSKKIIEDTIVTPIDTIMIQETAVNSLQPGDVIKLKVPNGFEWVGTLPSVISDWGFSGKFTGTPSISADGRTLSITCSGTATSSTEGLLYVGMNSYAKLQVTDESAAEYGDVVMHVSGDDVTEQDVTIADYESTKDATLRALQVDGTSVAGFAPSILSYDVVLAAGTVTVPTVTATVKDTGEANAVVTPATSLPGTTTVVVTAEDGTTTQTYTINFTVAPVAVTTASPNVNVSTAPLQITVPADVTNATLTLTSAPTVSGGNTTYTLPQVTTTAATSQGTVKVSISDGTTVTGLSSTFTGTINLPQVVSNPTVTVSGYNTSVSQAIELGSGNTALTFSHPVRILLAGQGGKLAGWIRNSSFTPITYQMASDSAAALGTNADGYIAVGSDLAIWTTHLTTFVAYTQTAITPSPSGGGGGGGGGSFVYTPAVQTEAASAVTADAAVLNGDITADNGYVVTDYGFLWGTSSGNLSNKVAVGNNDQIGTFKTTLSGLTAGTTYYYKAYATNQCGTVDGSIKSFATTEKAAVAAPVITPSPTTTPAAATFPDVPASYWGYNPISSLVSKDIVAGYTDGSFKPDASITRAEFATMLVKALNLSTSETTDRFTDVTADAWYYGTVNSAASKGLVSGMDNNRFAPDALITREQMAVMAAKALGNKAPAADGTELTVFKDKPAVSSWAVTGMGEAVKAGIVGGISPDMLAPQANATRAQAVEMIYKMLTVLSK